MRRYTATLVAKFSIEAENVVQARLAAKRIRSIGEGYGARRNLHERDSTSHRVTRILESVKIIRDPGREGTTRPCEWCHHPMKGHIAGVCQNKLCLCARGR